MIVGRIGDTSGAPYLEGDLYLSHQGLFSRISFLVDTGADSTTLMPIDGRNIGLDYARLRYADVATGVGGITQTFLEAATLTFVDTRRRRLHHYALTIDIIPPKPDLEGVKSLLGRDILKHWRMDWDTVNDKVNFTVRSADLTERF